MTEHPTLTPLPDGTPVPLEDCSAATAGGAQVWRTPQGRWLLPAFRGYAVDVGDRELPEDDDEDGLADLALAWVGAVRATDWTGLRGTTLDGDEWTDLRTAMVRVGWGPAGAQAAWQACVDRPYRRDLPTAAGWAGGGWVVPAAPGEPEPVFAQPVLETRGLLRWAYIARWQEPAVLPEGPVPPGPDPGERGWADVLARLRADHYTAEALEEAETLAVEVLTAVGLGPSSALEAVDDPLPDRHIDGACQHDSAVVRAAAWLLLRSEGDTWLACAYGECQHHWAVEAEEDAFEQEEVLELAARGVTNPVDAAYQRRRLLTMAFGDINDVPLAGAGDLEDFLAFYDGWVAAGRPEDDFADAARELRGDDEPPERPSPDST